MGVITEDNNSESLRDKIMEYFGQLYMGGKNGPYSEELNYKRVYHAPNANAKRYYDPKNLNSNYHIEVNLMYPASNNPLGLPNNMSSMVSIRISFVKTDKPWSDYMARTVFADSVILLFTKQITQPIMKKFMLGESDVQMVKDIFIEYYMRDLNVAIDGRPFEWVDDAGKFRRALISQEDRFEFLYEIYRRHKGETGDQTQN